MSKTISFVASDELAEFLEKESDRRMTTISSTAQMLLAEHVRGLRDDRAAAESETNYDGSEEREESSNERSDPPKEEVQEEEEPEPEEEETESGPVQQVFERHDEKWHYTREGSKNKVAVRMPDGELQYYLTERGAAARLAEEYGADGIDIDMGVIRGGAKDAQF